MGKRNFNFHPSIARSLESARRGNGTDQTLVVDHIQTQSHLKRIYSVLYWSLLTWRYVSPLHSSPLCPVLFIPRSLWCIDSNQRRRDIPYGCATPRILICARLRTSWPRSEILRIAGLFVDRAENKSGEKFFGVATQRRVAGIYVTSSKLPWVQVTLQSALHQASLIRRLKFSYAYVGTPRVRVESEWV